MSALVGLDISEFVWYDIYKVREMLYSLFEQEETTGNITFPDKRGEK